MDNLTRLHAASRAHRTRIRFWLWVVIALSLLLLAGYVGGRMLGHSLMRDVQWHEPRGQPQAAAVPILQLDSSQQGHQLTGHGSYTAPVYAAPSGLADAAARSEVVIDENGVAYELAPENGTALDAMDGSIDDTPLGQDPLLAFEEPKEEPVSVASGHARPSSVASAKHEVDIFFGQ